MHKVEQVDRQLVADLIADLGEVDQFEVAEVLSGDSDYTQAVQRVAAHRIAAERAQAKKDAGIAQEIANGLSNTDEKFGAEEAARAILSQLEATPDQEEQ